MRRELVGRNDEAMAIVDTYYDIFMRPHFNAGVIVDEMRPVSICKRLGTFATRKEAVDAARAAINSPRTTPDAYRKALEAIASPVQHVEGVGMEHAVNTIERLREIAREALGELK